MSLSECELIFARELMRIFRLFIFLFLAACLWPDSALSAGPVSVMMDTVVFCQPDSDLRPRLPSIKELAEYAKQIEATAIKSFQAAADLKPTSGAIVVAIRPGRKAKAWLMSSEYDFPQTVSKDFQAQFGTLRPARVNLGPVAFALLFTINGGGKPLVSPGSMMPMPQEWQEASKNATRPLLVPDDILAVIWPDDSPRDLTKLIDVPDGYELQKLDIANGCIAKPKGWFYSFSRDPNRNLIAWTLSREDSNASRVETGLIISYYYNLLEAKNRSLQAYVQKFISGRKHVAKKIVRDCSPVSIGQYMRTCLETMETMKSSSGVMADYHVLYSVFWSDKRDEFIITTFGTPAGEWEKNRPIVDVMQHFVMHCEECCKGKTPLTGEKSAEKEPKNI